MAGFARAQALGGLMSLHEEKEGEEARRADAEPHPLAPEDGGDTRAEGAGGGGDGGSGSASEPEQGVDEDGLPRGEVRLDIGGLGGETGASVDFGDPDIQAAEQEFTRSNKSSAALVPPDEEASEASTSAAGAGATSEEAPEGVCATIAFWAWMGMLGFGLFLLAVLFVPMLAAHFGTHAAHYLTSVCGSGCYGVNRTKYKSKDSRADSEVADMQCTEDCCHGIIKAIGFALSVASWVLFLVAWCAVKAASFANDVLCGWEWLSEYSSNYDGEHLPAFEEGETERVNVYVK